MRLVIVVALVWIALSRVPGSAVVKLQRFLGQKYPRRTCVQPRSRHALAGRASLRERAWGLRYWLKAKQSEAQKAHGKSARRSVWWSLLIDQKN